MLPPCSVILVRSGLHLWVRDFLPVLPPDLLQGFIIGDGHTISISLYCTVSRFAARIEWTCFWRRSSSCAVFGGRSLKPRLRANRQLPTGFLRRTKWSPPSGPPGGSLRSSKAVSAACAAARADPQVGNTPLRWISWVVLPMPPLQTGMHPDQLLS